MTGSQAPPPPRLTLSGEAVSIRPFEDRDAQELLDLRTRNREFFQIYEPSTVVIPATLREQRDRLGSERADWDEGRGYVFGIFRDDDGTLVGRVALSHVARGGWQNRSWVTSSTPNTTATATRPKQPGSRSGSRSSTRSSTACRPE